MLGRRAWSAIVVPAAVALAMGGCPNRSGSKDEAGPAAGKTPARPGAPSAQSPGTSASAAGGGEETAAGAEGAAAQPASAAGAGGQAAGGVVEAPARTAPRPAGRILTLLYSSNLQGEYEAHPLGGLARRATFTAAVRKVEKGVLNLDAGDTFLPALAPAAGDPPPDPGEVARRAELIAAALGRIGLDAFLPGETDLALGLGTFRKLVRKHRLPVLAANLLDRKGKPLFTTHKLVEVGGIRVGLLGVLTASDEGRAALEAEGLSLGDASGTAQGNASLLREQGAEVVVGLFHLGGGRAEAEKLLAEVSGIDVAILGHELGHEALTLENPAVVTPTAEGGTALASAGKWGKFLGRLDLHLVDGDPGFVAARSAGEGSWFENQIIRLDTRFVSDPKLVTLIKAYRQVNRRRADKRLPVGLTAQPGTDGKLATSAEEHWKYASTRACRLCHFQADDHFQNSVHAFALQTLQNKARERDPRCLACHTTGFERPGGTRNLETAVTYFANVGCESCHGPSGDHIRSQNKTGTRLKVPESVCRECHTPEQSPVPFDYQVAKREVLGPGHGEPLPGPGEGTPAAPATP